MLAGAVGKPDQIIVATHSPFVVHGSPAAKCVVLGRDRQTSWVRVKAEAIHPGAGSAEVALAAFDLIDFVREARGKRLALIVEGPTDRAILEEAWRKLRSSQPMPFMIRSGDGARNIPRLLGAGGGKSGPLLDALADSGIVLVGLFDFDHEEFAQWNGAIGAADAEINTSVETTCLVRKRRGMPIWSALLPVPAFRSGYASPMLGGDSRLTIELLFSDAYVGPLLQCLRVAGDGGASRLAAVSNGQKELVAAAAASFPPEAFVEFTPVINLLERIAVRQGSTGISP